MVSRETAITEHLLIDCFICLPLQKIVPVVQTAGVLDNSVLLGGAVPVCARDATGARAAVAMAVDAAMVAVKRLCARNAVSETLAQIECVGDST